MCNGRFAWTFVSPARSAHYLTKANELKAAALATLLRHRISKVASAPLRRSHVERILHITYSSTGIAELAARPATIEAWRREDDSCLSGPLVTDS